MDDDSLNLHDSKVTIELVGEGRLEFRAGWNNGLQEFVSDFEAHARGETRSPKRYSMRTYDRKESHSIVLSFDSVVAIHLVVNLP